MEERIDKMDEKFENRFAEMDEKFEARFVAMEERIDKMDEKFETRFKDMEGKFDVRFTNMEERFDKVEAKLNITTNTNIAQILNTVTETKEELTKFKKEINDKLDKYIEKNELEHKRFELKLAEETSTYKYKK